MIVRKLSRLSRPQIFVTLLIIMINLGLLKLVSSGVDKFSRGDFPANFVFGSGTTAYQVEGAAFDDGKTPSTWDTFAHSGHVHGATGDIACDGYHKYKEDIQLMADVGLEAYRFSISWPRLIPRGREFVNPKGLKYYNNVINELIRHGIQPHVTLYHGDLPQTLEDEYGGWLNKKSVRDFMAYADVCFREFGGRVLHWTTFSDANMLALAGYDVGMLPPGRCSSPFGINCVKGNSSYEPYTAAHNILLAHASAARLYQKKYKAAQHGFVGLNILAFWFVPCTNAVEDVIATQRAFEYYIGWFVDPLMFGDYPDIVKKNADTRIPAFTEAESKLVKGSVDFLGVNHYATMHIKDKSSNLNTDSRDVLADMAIDMTCTSAYHDDTSPNQGMKELLEYFKHIYGNPTIYIHENGLSLSLSLSLSELSSSEHGKRTQRNGTLNDPTRVKFMQGFIGSLLDALRNGANARGYFYWAFLDVFEVLDGYGSAYGLYYVDLDDRDLKRYPKLSAHWYSSFLKGTMISDS